MNMLTPEIFFHAKSYTRYYDAQTETMGNESCLRSEMSRAISPGASSLMRPNITRYKKTRSARNHTADWTDVLVQMDRQQASYDVCL